MLTPLNYLRSIPSDAKLCDQSLLQFLEQGWFGQTYRTVMYGFSEAYNVRSVSGLQESLFDRDQNAQCVQCCQLWFQK